MAPTRRASATGEWRKDAQHDTPGSAGGCPTHASFFENPQFRLELTGLQQEITVTLSQAPLGGAPFSAPHPIGFVVLTAPDAQGLTKRKSLGAPGGHLGYKAIVHVCPGSYTAQEQVGATIVLERGELPYYIVPCTAEPNCEATFSLEVRSNFGVGMQALPHRGSLPEPELEYELEADDEASAPRQAVAPGVKALGGKGYGFPLGGEGGEAEAAALVAKLAPKEQYEDAGFFGDVALYGDRSVTPAEKAAANKVQWRSAAKLVEGGGGWGPQLETLADAVLLLPAAQLVQSPAYPA